MKETARERWERIEHLILSNRAAFSDASQGRKRAEADCLLRTVFQRDRDRIIHCNAFRRLKHKTQVFLSPEGDHYRTRLTHTLEVSQIARTIARALRLNEDLTEAIALGHDLGHTPFGHAGERALNQCMEGGFRHYEQSVRVVDKLEKKGEGLNLTAEVVDGILKHTCLDAITDEGKLVRLADRIAYINHDIEDAIRAGILKNEDIPKDIRDKFGEKKSQRINSMITMLIENSVETIGFNEEDQRCFDKLHNFMFERVYYNPTAKGEETKVESLVAALYTHYSSHPDKLPEEYDSIREEEEDGRAACDYIAGMTDRYALDIYKNMLIPKFWNV